MEAREAPLTGHRYVAVRLLEPIRAGEELLLDYGSDYPRHLFAKSAKRRRLTAAGEKGSCGRLLGVGLFV